MFESTGWLLEEPEVNDTSKFDMIFPTVVRPPNSTSVLQGVDNIEVSLPCEVVVLCQQRFPFYSSLDFSQSHSSQLESPETWKLINAPAVCVTATAGDWHCSPVSILIKSATYECHHENAGGDTVPGVLQGFP